MTNMKRITTISTFVSLLFMAVSCYSDFVMDYDYTGAYITYQYDERTFVYGENNAVGITVCLGGTINNDRDRRYNLEVDNTILKDNLLRFSSAPGADPCTALDGLKGKATLGVLSNSYVSNDWAKNTEVCELPSSYYYLEGMDNLVVKKGRHTATVKIVPSEQMFNDENTLRPYYALGFVLTKADADSLLLEHSFQVLAIKVENKFYGNWYHGGRMQVRLNSTGAIVSEDYKSMGVPQKVNDICVMTTTDFKSVKTDKILHSPGELSLNFNDDGTIDVSDPSGALQIRTIPGQPSHHNGAKLLQDRRIYLNYAYSDGKGTTTYVTDTLAFRNRIRDGFNEWQDENPENYE